MLKHTTRASMVTFITVMCIMTQGMMEDKDQLQYGDYSNITGPCQHQLTQSV